MELLLLTCHHISYAIQMKQVSRIIKISSIDLTDSTDKNPFLLEPGNEEFGVLLTNNHILPVEKVERMIHHEGDAIEANDFLKGCMTDANIDGFVAINEKIYGMLNKRFLKFVNPEVINPEVMKQNQPPSHNSSGSQPNRVPCKG